MKSYILLNKCSLLIIGVMFFLSSCSTWHYHYPRTKIEPTQVNEVIETSVAPQQSPATADVAVDNETEVIQPNSTEVASVETEPQKQVLPVEHKSPVKAKKESKKPFSFIEKLKKDGERLFKINEVEKSALSGWVRIMVILFVVGFILVLIGIFLSVFLHPGFWWLFYFFGSLCILAGFIVLILGLVGIMV